VGKKKKKLCPFCLSLLRVIIFGCVRFLLKKITKLNFFKKKTETGSNRPVSVWFGFLGQKPVWLGFFGLARFFSSFFQFGFGSVFLVLGL
jgi:hypothetical protein